MKTIKITFVIILFVFNNVFSQNYLSEDKIFLEDNFTTMIQKNNQQNKNLLVSHYYLKGNLHANEYYTYNDFNQLSEFLIDFVSTSPPDRKREYIYNEDSLLVTVKAFNRPNDTTDWVYSGVTYYEYNNEGKNTLRTVRQIQDSQEMNVVRDKYIYENNLEKEEIRQEWKDEKWNDYYKITKTYDSNENIVETVMYDYESNEWKFHLKINYSYENNKLSNEIYDWEIQEYKIIDYTYAENYKLLNTYVSTSLNDYKTDYYSKEENFYDSEGYLINQKVFIWNKDVNDFVINTEYINEYSSITSVSEINSHNSFEVKLQNYPNPFNPTTTISYYIPKTSNVTIKIYDSLGKELKTLINEEKPAGNFSLEFNAEKLASGIYFYQIIASEFLLTKKMLLIK